MCAVRSAPSPPSGHLFIFFNRRKDQVRILFGIAAATWVGQAIERVVSRCPAPGLTPEALARIEAAELSLILEGARLQGAQLRPRWQPPAPQSP